MIALLDVHEAARFAKQLNTLHDRGVVNEAELLDVIRELAAGQALTFDHLARIFGADRLYELMGQRVIAIAEKARG